MPKKSNPPVVVGRKYGKFDLDRVGFFEDGVSGPFGEYRGGVVARKEASKGGQILAGPRMELFEKNFVRIFSGEGLSETWRAESKKRALDRKKNVGAREFQIAGPAKQHSTPNDFFGCFGEPGSALDHAPCNKPKKKGARELPNCKIKPNPLGGPGYANICLSDYPKHDQVDPYETKKYPKGKTEQEGRFLTASVPQPYFPPNPYKSTTTGPTYVAPATSGARMIGPGRIYVPGPKEIGGCKAGCFDKFPRYDSSPYDVRTTKDHVVAGVRWLGGYPDHREKYTRSIIDYGTRVSCNANNYPEYRERIYPLGS